jgi:hypothetical protein
MKTIARVAEGLCQVWVKKGVLLGPRIHLLLMVMLPEVIVRSRDRSSSSSQQAKAGLAALPPFRGHLTFELLEKEEVETVYHIVTYRCA